jgi:hypothetical protein
MGQAIKKQYHTHNHSNFPYHSLIFRSLASLEAFWSLVAQVVVAENASRLISVAACSPEDAVDGAQIQRRSWRQYSEAEIACDQLGGVRRKSAATR